MRDLDQHRHIQVSQVDAQRRRLLLAGAGAQRRGRIDANTGGWWKFTTS